MTASPFRTPIPDGRHISFLTVRTTPTPVILVAPPGQFHTLNLHCFTTSSYVCWNEEECPHCHPVKVPARLYAFAPCLTLGDSGQWKQAILPVGDPFGEVAERDMRGFKCGVYRKRKSDGTYSALLISESTPVPVELQVAIRATWFDIRPRLLRRYGISMDAVALGEPPVEAMQPAKPTEPREGVLSFSDAYQKWQQKRGA
jgi:hypothetical protein